MTHEPPEQAQLNALWREVNKAITDRAWPEAEGLLLRYLQIVPQAPLEAWDVLAYVDLMQGNYRRCLEVLRPWADHPSRNFWLQHKLGDAHRGLNQLPQAEACYRQSLVDGSDSPLTIRNLLQVLDGMDPGRAVHRYHERPLVPAATEVVAYSVGDLHRPTDGSDATKKVTATSDERGNIERIGRHA